MPEKGYVLNDRVWKLFERAGFITQPNSGDKSEPVIELAPGKIRTPDFFIEDRILGVKIIGWNKARPSLNESITVHLHDYQKLKELTRANGVLFILSEKEIEEDKNYAESLGMRVWGKKDLEYYESLVDTIGNYAKYEIIHSLGITTTEETNIYNVLAIHIRQPYRESSTDCFLFTITPQILLKTGVILRKAQGSKFAYQRILQKKRLAKIKAFVTKPDSLLPPNIIVSFTDKVRYEIMELPKRDSQGRGIIITNTLNYELVVLSIPIKYASLEIIDGQHRLYGFHETDAATKDHFNLIVLGMANIDQVMKTNTFIAINDNAKKVDPNLVAYLKYEEEEEICKIDNVKMAIKIVVGLNNTTPFKNKIRILDIGNEVITLKGFTGYDLRGLISERGILRKYYKHSSKEYIGLMRLYFSILKSLFPDQWNDQEKFIIFTNRGISAFLKLLKSIIKTEGGRINDATIRKYLQPLINGWGKSNWEKDKLLSAYVGSKGWKDFHMDMVKIIKNKYPEFIE